MAIGRAILRSHAGPGSRVIPGGLAVPRRQASHGSSPDPQFPGHGVEYRALPFNWNRAGFDSRGSGTNGNFPDGQVNTQDETFRFNQMITISVGFSLPAKPKISE